MQTSATTEARAAQGRMIPAGEGGTEVPLVNDEADEAEEAVAAAFLIDTEGFLSLRGQDLGQGRAGQLLCALRVQSRRHRRHKERTEGQQQQKEKEKEPSHGSRPSVATASAAAAATPALLELDLGRCMLDEASLCQLLEALRTHPTLECLDLGSARIVWEGEGRQQGGAQRHVAPVVDVAGERGQVELDAGEGEEEEDGDEGEGKKGWWEPSQGAWALASLVRHNATLTELNVDDIALGRHALPLLHALAHNSTLQRLGLSWNGLGDAEAVVLAQALEPSRWGGGRRVQGKQGWSKDCRQDGGVGGGRVSVGTVTGGGSGRSGLVCVWCTWNEISVAGAAVLAKALRHSHTLHTLLLYNGAVGMHKAGRGKGRGGVEMAQIAALTARNRMMGSPLFPLLLRALCTGYGLPKDLLVIVAEFVGCPTTTRKGRNRWLGE